LAQALLFSRTPATKNKSKAMDEAREVFKTGGSFDGVVNQAPGQMAMVEEAFNKHPQGVLVKQTMKGCLRNCLGCQAKQEYHMSGMDYNFLQTSGILSEGHENLPNDLYILEESSCFLRLCWRDGRPLEFNVSTGGEAGGAPVAKFKKPCGFPLYCSVPVPVNGDGDFVEVTFPCCCLLPTLAMDDGAGGELSKSEYLCRYNSCCIPQLQYNEPPGNPVYYLAPNTCCLGFCISCNFGGGKGCCRMPFLFHDAVTMERLPTNADGNDPQISKVWAGMKKECCSTADNFVVMWPDGIDAKRKAGLLGLTLLLDFTVFERQQGQ